jgi:hypothetical protein
MNRQVSQANRTGISAHSRPAGGGHCAGKMQRLYARSVIPRCAGFVSRISDTTVQVAGARQSGPALRSRFPVSLSMILASPLACIRLSP